MLALMAQLDLIKQFKTAYIVIINLAEVIWCKLL